MLSSAFGNKGVDAGEGGDARARKPNPWKGPLIGKRAELRPPEKGGKVAGR